MIVKLKMLEHTLAISALLRTFSATSAVGLDLAGATTAGGNRLMVSRNIWNRKLNHKARVSKDLVTKLEFLLC